MDEILEALGDEYSADILGATEDALSAQELSETLDVPIATCYRRIEQLTESGLLEHHDRILSDDRRRVNVYRRGVSRVSVTFDNGVNVDIEERGEVKNKLDDVWRTLSDPEHI